MGNKETEMLCSPEELVGLIKNGESVYFEELFTRFLPLVKNMNHKYYLRFMEQDDFWQEARIVLHKAVVAYDPEKGLQFPSFFKLMFEHHVYSLIRKETALKRKIDKGAVSAGPADGKRDGEPLEPSSQWQRNATGIAGRCCAGKRKCDGLF